LLFYISLRWALRHLIRKIAYEREGVKISL
jgi:hypothetical protein